MKTRSEFNTFNDAMTAILRADPTAVKAEMEAESRAQAAQRAAKGERKRGKKAAKKRPSVSFRASSARDD